MISTLDVEDDFLLARNPAAGPRAWGAEVIGPAPDGDAALDLLERADRPDGAVLDSNLQGAMAWPVADALMERATPFVFAAGYDRTAVPPRSRDVPRCGKPTDAFRIGGTLFG